MGIVVLLNIIEKCVLIVPVIGPGFGSLGKIEYAHAYRAQYLFLEISQQYSRYLLSFLLDHALIGSNCKGTSIKTQELTNNQFTVGQAEDIFENHWGYWLLRA